MTRNWKKYWELFYASDYDFHVVLTAVLLIWNRDFLMAFGASENTIEYGVNYMNIYALGRSLWKLRWE